MSIFYVVQRKAYVEELKDGFVLSPKLIKSKHQNIGFSIMTKIKKGDFIIHHCNREIKAISITKSDCYDSTRTAYKMGDVSMISWTRFGRILSNQRRCPNVTKIHQRIQRNDSSTA